MLIAFAPISEKDEILSDVTSRLWFTYRKNFLPIGKLCGRLSYLAWSILSTFQCFLYLRLQMCCRWDRAYNRHRLGLHAAMWTDDLRGGPGVQAFRQRYHAASFDIRDHGKMAALNKTHGQYQVIQVRYTHSDWTWMARNASPGTIYIVYHAPNDFWGCLVQIPVTTLWRVSRLYNRAPIQPHL